MHIASDTEDIETLVKWVDSLYAKRENEIAEGIWAITPWLGKEGTDWEYTDEEQGFYQITPHYTSRRLDRESDCIPDDNRRAERSRIRLLRRSEH